MEGREVVSLGGVGHGELSEGFFGLTPLIEFALMCLKCYVLSTFVSLHIP